MTKKEQSELNRLHRKVTSGKATRKEVLKAIDLRNKLNREAAAEHDEFVAACDQADFEQSCML